MSWKPPFPLVKLADCQQNFDSLAKELEIVAFNAYRGSAFTVVVGGSTIVFDTVVEDTLTKYDTATGLYTIRDKGWYRFSWHLQLGAAMTSGQLLWSAIYNGATQVGNGSRSEQVGSNGLCTVGSISLPCEVGDQIKIVSGVTGANKAGQTGRGFTSFHGERIGRT